MKNNGEYREISLVTEKKKIRREILEIRNNLSEQDQQRASCLITERLLGHQWFYRARSVLCYVSYGSELDTKQLIAEALRLGKEVYVPKVIAEHDMAFYQISTLEELRPGFHGIPEPSVTTSEYTRIPASPKTQPDLSAQYNSGQIGEQVLMVMPGVAYDVYGNRLGYGGGYYDRYLTTHPEFQTYSIGIGHNCQRVERLPVEKTDCKPYQVILV